MKFSSSIILASQSPRRAELLSQIGLNYCQRSAQIDETPFAGEEPLVYVERMACEKASAIAETVGAESVVIGADTIGEIEGQILVKPKDFSDFKAMFKLMSDNIHYVHTAVAVASIKQIDVAVVSSEVRFGTVSEQEMSWYWDTGEPKDKAGGYAIQGLGGQFVKQINGSYSNIVGLPLYETAEMLKKAGVKLHER